MWADHQLRETVGSGNGNPLSNRGQDNNVLIKPYLNGVYEKSDMQIQNIMQRHRQSANRRSGKNLKARGNVEDWLSSVEARMKQSLHGLMKAGYMLFG